MKNILTRVPHGLMTLLLKKTVVTIAVIATLPISVAVAEPAIGSFGSLALMNAASTVAQVSVKQSKTEQYVAEITAYTSRASETDSDPFISADGNYVYDGLVACSREYPFGTKVVINGRTYRCGDRMAQKNDHARNLSLTKPRFDIWMDSLSDAKQFGRRELAVTVILPNTTN